MIRFGYFFAFAFAFNLLMLMACNNKSNISTSSMQRTSGMQHASSVESGILNMNVLFTDAERNVSFPIWFKDSTLSKEKIVKITRRIYLLDEEENSSIDALENAMPREKREYWFDSDGEIKNLKVTYYYDNQEIGTTSFLYEGKKDRFGYAKVSRVLDTLNKTTSDDDDLHFYHNIHKKIKQTSKYLTFRNVHSESKIFYMLHEKYWGPLSVDSIIKPKLEDIVILGSPYYPSKQYRVRNKVNEIDVVVYNYTKESKMIESLTRFEYPFEIKRTFLNNKSGWCKGYVDSTFSNNTYLTKTLSEITFNKKNLPLRIIRQKENQMKNSSIITIETFTYEL